MRWVPAVLALCIVAVSGCSDDESGDAAGETSSETSGETSGADASDDFCSSWVTLQDDDSEPASEDAWTAVIDRFQVVRDAAPEDLRDDVEPAIDSVEGFVERLAEFDYDQEALSTSLSEDELTEIQQSLAPLGELFAESDVARFAHENCEGANDPTFEISCPQGTASSLGAVGSALGEAPEGEGQPLDDLVADELSELPDGSTTAERDAEGGRVEVAFLDPDGRTIQLVEYDEVGDGYRLASATNCR